MKRSLAVIALLLNGWIVSAYAAQPMETLKGPIDQVLAVLKDPRYQGADRKKLQRDKLWEIIRPVFDFEEISKRTLAINWKRFSADQQKEFTTVFSKFLGNTYLDKIQGEYQNETIVFLDEEMYSDTKAFVRTKVVRKDKSDIPINYSMMRIDGIWRIYDVHIEGVSLVKNYRSQFNELLGRETPAQLIERLKKKLDAQQKS